MDWIDTLEVSPSSLIIGRRRKNLRPLDECVLLLCQQCFGMEDFGPVGIYPVMTIL